MTTRSKRRSQAGKIYISCIVLVLAAILSIQIVRLHGRSEDYRMQQERLEAELQEEQERAEDLKEQEEYVGSEQYVEDTAKSKLGMSYPDEIIFREE